MVVDGNVDGIVIRDELLAMGEMLAEELEGQALVDELLAQGFQLKTWGKTSYYENDNGEMGGRNCTKCDVIKSAEKFPLHKRSRGGISNACLNCERIRVARWYADPESPERIERKRLWDRDNYRVSMNCPEFRKRERQRIAVWGRNNTDKRRLSKLRRRARVASLPDDWTQEDRVEMLERFNGECSLTGTSSDLNYDHAIPIAVGHGGTTRGNMIPMHGRLNESKASTHIFEWFEANRERFGLEQRKFDELIEYLAQVNEMTTQEYRAYVDWCFDNPRDISELKDAI